MRLLVTGVSGYVGAALVPRLQARRARRARLRALARAGRGRRRRLDDVVLGDAITGAGLGRALDGVDVAYYLIHSMEGAGEQRLPRPASGARPSASPPRPRAAGVRRIVYLGGLVPHDGAASRHLASRLAVEQALLDAAPESIALRASIVIGARSRSFRFLVRLIERLPVLAAARLAHQPHAADRRARRARVPGRAPPTRRPRRRRPLVGHRRPGRDELRGADRADRRRACSSTARRSRLGFSLTPVASVVAAAVAGEDPGLIDAADGVARARPAAA